MANNIYSPGQQIILNSSSTGPGSWYRVHPGVKNIGFQAVLTGSSVGVTVGSVINLEASNDGVNALATTLGTITLNGASPQSDGLTINAHWEYVRPNVSSITTGSNTVTASAQFQSGG